VRGERQESGNIETAQHERTLRIRKKRYTSCVLRSKRGPRRAKYALLLRLETRQMPERPAFRAKMQRL
jgi:hypothetical protein